MESNRDIALEQQEMEAQQQEEKQREEWELYLQQDR